MAREGQGLAAAMPVLAVVFLTGCASAGKDSFVPSCQPFDPDKTQSCTISSERWSEIGELPEPPGMYRYCAWPGLLSGAYRTRYRDLDGSVHDFTQATLQTPSLLVEALKGAGDAPRTDVIVYRMVPRTRPCPNAPP